MTGLDAVRRHQLATARAEAESILQDARQQAGAIAATGESDAAALLEGARQEGETAASLDTDRAWKTARRRARGTMLAAQRETYEELRSRIAFAIRHDQRYPVLLERLGHAAQRQLGPGARVEVDRDGDGAVTATRKDRRIQWSLAAIVEAGLDELGPTIAEVWQ